MIVLFYIHCICYWLMVLIYDKNVPLKDYNNAVVSSLKNQILYTLPITVIFFNYYPINYNDFIYSIGYLPFLIVTSDGYFYLTHRPLHTKAFYHLHKHHHTGIVCVAKSLDAGAIEHIIGNLGSFIIGILLLWYCNCIVNIYIFGGWIGFVTLNTCISHSNKTCFLDSGNHLHHHKYLNSNYGFGLYTIDRLIGTFGKLKKNV